MISPVRVVAPTRVKRGRSSRMRPGAGALAEHDVELEVLHGRVQDLLHRPAQAVDLVDEEHVALGQVGEDGGQVAGPHQGRSGGDPEAGPHLVGDDPGQRGLPQPGRPGEQQVIGRLRSPPGRLQHDLEVLLELGLADELGQPPGPEGDLLGGLHRVGRPAPRGGRVPPLSSARRVRLHVGPAHRAPASSRRASLIWSSRSPSAGRRPGRGGSRRRRSRGRPGRRAPRPGSRRPRLRPPPRPARGPTRRRSAPSRSMSSRALSSTSSRTAVFLPMPGHEHQGVGVVG